MTGPELCLIAAILFEGSIEPREGMIAIGTNVMARVESHRYPDTICGVVTQCNPRACQYSFMRDGQSERISEATKATDNYKRVERAAKEVLQGTTYAFNGIPTHYCNHRIGNCWWAPKFKHLGDIGKHSFYDENG